MIMNKRDLPPIEREQLYLDICQALMKELLRNTGGPVNTRATKRGRGDAEEQPAAMPEVCASNQTMICSLDGERTRMTAVEHPADEIADAGERAWDQAGCPSTSRRRLYSVHDVCLALQLGRTFIFSEIKARRLRSILCGRRRMFTAEALAAYIADREAEAGPEVAP
jgi:hypothetical protein